MNLNSNNFLISKLNLNRTRKDKLVHSFIPKKHCLPFSFLFFFYASNHSFQYESKSSSPFNYSPHPVKLNCTVYFLNFHPDRHFIKLFVPRHLFAYPLPHSNSHTKIIEKFRAKNEAVHRRRSRTMDRTFTFFFFPPPFHNLSDRSFRQPILRTLRFHVPRQCRKYFFPPLDHRLIGIGKKSNDSRVLRLLLY